MNRAIAFSAKVEKAGVVGERDGALERDTITRLQTTLKEIIFLKHGLSES